MRTYSGPVYSHVGYDGFGRKLYETPPVSSVTYDEADKYKIFTYNAAGRVWKSYSQNEDGVEVCTQEILYDKAGRQEKVISLPNDTTGLRTETETHYDGTQQDWVKDALGNVTSFEYDALGRVTKTIHPATAVEGVGAVPTYSHVGYDGLGRKVWESAQTVYDNSAAHPVPVSEIKAYEYDITGRLKAVILPPVNDPQNSNTLTWPRYEYDYDMYGNLSSIRDKVRQLVSPFTAGFDASNSAHVDRSVSRVTSFTYDSMNRQVSRTVPGGGTEYKGYDDKGRPEWEMDFKEQVVGYEYNALGQLEYKKYYAADGTPGDHANSNYPNTPTQEVAFTYDSHGRKWTETVTDIASQAVTYEVEYSYDAEGNLTKIDSPQGIVNYAYHDRTGRKDFTFTGQNLSSAENVVWYGYDSLGRLEKTQVLVRNGNSLIQKDGNGNIIQDNSETTAYAYDKNGNRLNSTLPNGVYTWYDYNAVNRLTTLRHFSQVVTDPLPDTYRISGFAYRLNAAGMRTGVTEYLGEPRYQEYQYDNLNRLETEYSDNKPSANVGDTPLPAGIRGYRAKYEYDLIGNRQKRQVNLINTNNYEDGGEVLSTEYTVYDDNDRLRKEHDLSSAVFTALPWDRENRVYACADGKGGFGYYRPGMGAKIGQLTAFCMGLPSVCDRWVVAILLVLIPLVFLWPAVAPMVLSWRSDTRERPTLSLYHRCLCVLLAYIFLIGPETFVQLANAEVQYNDLTTQAWGHAGDYKTYYYDANGSLTYTIYSDESTSGDPATIVAADSNLKYDRNEYNLQNRLSKVTRYSKSGSTATRLITEYVYNPEGIRVSSTSYTTTNNGNPEDKTQTDYLIDPANHTGYAQVLEERTTSFTTSDVPTTQGRIQYTLGDDVISQTRSDWAWSTETTTWVHQTTFGTEYLLYDGHGSTRQLVNHPVPPAQPTVIDSFSYDGYGVMLDNTANPADTASNTTRLLYCGEQYDKSLSQYYLRARYYNPSNGRFNRMDSFEGSPSDPQSLHKYTYCHNNPINGTDPTGESLLLNFTASTAIMGIIAGITFATMGAVCDIYRGGLSAWEIVRNAVTTFGVVFTTFVCPLAMILALAIGTARILTSIASGEMKGRDWVELGSYIVVGLLLLIIFRNAGLIARSGGASGGHHSIIPRGGTGRLSLKGFFKNQWGRFFPRFIRDASANLIKKGSTQTEYLLWHFRVDPSFRGTAGWKPPAGATKYNIVGRLWHGSPPWLQNTGLYLVFTDLSIYFIGATKSENLAEDVVEPEYIETGHPAEKVLNEDTGL